jgi:hypothetical protein
VADRGAIAESPSGDTGTNRAGRRGSDFADGRVARWTGQADGIGRWLDGLADVVFVLTALASEAAAGVIPICIPLLIACSFAQYAIDSVAIRGSSTPVRSRLGHWAASSIRAGDGAGLDSAATITGAVGHPAIPAPRDILLRGDVRARAQLQAFEIDSLQHRG